MMHIRKFEDKMMELMSKNIAQGGSHLYAGEEAVATGIHENQWLNRAPTGERVTWRVIIFFPWDSEARLFTGERVYTFFPDGEDL